MISDREIGNVQIGGDVVGTTIESGYNQNLTSVIQNPASPPTPSPQQAGLIRINIAGNVQNSIIAASVAPGTNGRSVRPINSSCLAAGIDARVEGTIDNSTATPGLPEDGLLRPEGHSSTRARSSRRTSWRPPISGPLQPKSLPGIPHPYVSHLTSNKKAD